jgi:putative transposase
MRGASGGSRAPEPVGLLPVCVRPLPVNWCARRVQVFAAVAPQTGELFCLILPTANTAMTPLFLAYVSQSLSEYFIVMQLDQAGWHHSRSLQVPENIRLIAQPAHSPEVNPVKLSIATKNWLIPLFDTGGESPGG